MPIFFGKRNGNDNRISMDTKVIVYTSILLGMIKIMVISNMDYLKKTRLCSVSISESMFVFSFSIFKVDNKRESENPVCRPC
jgi:hypothetical protein